MRSTVLNFPAQLKWRPVVEGGSITLARHYLLCGMGGSALAGGFLTACDPSVSITVDRDYGLPMSITTDSRRPLVIVSSFSGNTEETLDAYRTAREAKLSLIVITAGGEILGRARRDKVPYIVLPDATIEPRLAVGYFLKALALIAGAKEISNELESLAPVLDMMSIETEGHSFAKHLVGRLPLFYASNRYAALAYFWKTMMNETAKTPAFSNIIPEENHNELESFSGISEGTLFTVVMIGSEDDHPRVNRRFALLTEILPSLQIPVEKIFLTGVLATERVIRAILLAIFTALALAEARGVDPSAVPIIEDFKSKLA